MRLRNTDKLPAEVVPLLRKHVRILVAALGDKLVGVYVHGSAALGGFTFAHSDLDYLAVVAAPLTAAERRVLADSWLATYGQNVPAKGVEMSIVPAEFAGAGFRYPTPYEFHMGTEEQLRLHREPHAQEMLDHDLAAHFTITQERGVCVYGRSIPEVFAKVPRAFYLDSIVRDAEESLREILEDNSSESAPVPSYAVLNACRVLAYAEEGLIASKSEGAQWAREHLPLQYHSLIAVALRRYSQVGAEEQAEPGLLQDFATYALNRIRAAIAPTDS
jgi:streptomycin 3"-adenylyltransferase